MENVDLKILNSDSYSELFDDKTHRFNTSAFNLMNDSKVDDLIFLGFTLFSKTRIGICLGLKNGLALAPFSSPFGGFSFTKRSIPIDAIDTSIVELLAHAKSESWKGIRITLPPDLYSESNSTKQLSAFVRAGFTVSSIELNHYFDLRSFNKNYIKELDSDARRNLNIAFKNNLEFCICKTEDEKVLAYEIIKKNRLEKGYPLHLSYSDIQKTQNIIPIDFFKIKDAEGNTNASAIVFHPTDNIAQVVYWGDLSQHKQNRSMNFLAFKLLEHYAGSKAFLDIGPSTEKGVPNTGLCNFKESIGCSVTPKFVLEWNP